ncbi:MAG: FAD-binding oxidoreductase [Candidatus Methanomethylophilaceae archaeon]
MIQPLPIRPDSNYLIDESKMRGTAEEIYFPKNKQEIREIVRSTDSENSHLTISAMRTGVCGGAVPAGGKILSLERMNHIIGIGYDDGYFVRVEPCVTVRQLSEMLLSKHINGLTDITEGALKKFKDDPKKYFYPVDPTETESSLGGNTATNASGPRTLKYGPTRNWIRGLEIILHDGTAIEIPRGKYYANGRHFDVVINGIHLEFDVPSYNYNTSVKNSTGLFSKDNMDLIDLFIGSEGLLGIFSSIDVRVTEWHPLVSNIMFFPDDDSALRFISEIRHREEISPEFLEYFDCNSIQLIRDCFSEDPSMLSPPEDAGSAVFFDLADSDVLKDAYDAVIHIAEKYDGSAKKSWCSSSKRDRDRMFRFRHAVPQAIFAYVASLKNDMPDIHKYGTDMSVPENRSKEMMDYYSQELKKNGLEYVIFGHMGNDHPHVEIILKNMDDFEKAKSIGITFAVKAVELGGSPSAEHGIGKIKKQYLRMMYNEKDLEEMRALKRYFDPDDILCPGNMLG